jgi:superfamily II DNA or RNA helicase
MIITINNVWSKVSELQDIDIIDALDTELSFFIEGYQYTKKYREGWFDKSGNFIHWDGKKHLLTRKLAFPTGLLERVKNFFSLRNIDFVIEDKREKFILNEIPLYYYNPRDYQIDALVCALKNERGMLRLGTGAGKTVLAAMMIAKYNLPTMVYVVGKDLLYQFHKELFKALKQDIGIIGDGECVVKKINVCSVWTAITSFGLKQQVSLDDGDWDPEIMEVPVEHKRLIKKTIENSIVSIYDEAHYLATDTIQSIYKTAKKSRYIFGLTATNWRDDGADLLLESICGPKIFNLPSSDLIKKKVLVPPLIKIFNVPSIPNLTGKYHSVYSQYIVKNDVRNGLIVQSAEALIKKGRRLLILVRHIVHGNILAKLLSHIPLYFVNGAVDGQTRMEVKEAFETGKLKCLIASSVYDLGIDIPCLDALILGGGGKSTVRALQRIGRVIRGMEGKSDAIVVDFFDNAKYLDKHSSIRIAVYKTESQFVLKFPEGFKYDKLKKHKKIKEKIIS